MHGFGERRIAELAGCVRVVFRALHHGGFTIGRSAGSGSTAASPTGSTWLRIARRARMVEAVNDVAELAAVLRPAPITQIEPIRDSRFPSKPYSSASASAASGRLIEVL